MATAPVKPQQLHNFPLSLKWGQTATISAASNHHNRTAASNRPPPPPDSETESDPDQPTSIRHPPRVGSRSARVHRFSFTSCSTLLPKSSPGTPQTQTPAIETEVSERLRNRVTISDNNNEADADEEGEAEQDKQKQDEDEGNSRRWKLRPRRTIVAGRNGGESKEAAMIHVHEQRERERETAHQFQPKSMRLRGLVDSAGGSGGVVTEKKEKRKFWISLSREEIEEDIFSMTGAKPARRPRKRPKNVQKAMDNLFPGLWLVGTTAESYRVADPPVKR